MITQNYDIFDNEDAIVLQHEAMYVSWGCWNGGFQIRLVSTSSWSNEEQQWSDGGGSE